jgi:hypothetical protein
MNNTVPNEELLKDIELTELELQAYVYLYQGYDILSRLPENIDRKSEYHGKYLKFISDANGCNDFLLRLRDMKKLRGLG